MVLLESVQPTGSTSAMELRPGSMVGQTANTGVATLD
jgi:hypothetical protein